MVNSLLWLQHFLQEGYTVALPVIGLVALFAPLYRDGMRSLLQAMNLLIFGSGILYFIGVLMMAGDSLLQAAGGDFELSPWLFAGGMIFAREMLFPLLCFIPVLRQSWGWSAFMWADFNYLNILPWVVNMHRDYMPSTMNIGVPSWMELMVDNLWDGILFLGLTFVIWMAAQFFRPFKP